MITIDSIIEHFGSPSALAKALDVTSQVVNNWKKRGRVPPARAKDVSNASGGKFKLEDLL
jgi:DNA-binding transcriptional regulator YdaS (Cro superfamily)